MQRRQYLSLLASGSLATLAGCSSDEQEEAARGAVDVIDDELGVVEWDLDNVFHVEYYASENPGFDVTVVSGSYAGAVDNDLEADAYAYGLTEGEAELYAFEIDREWAEAYNADEISEDEYHDQIAETFV